MKILYLHQYFKTFEEGGPIRSHYIAKGMVDAGHEVEMITSHNQSTKLITEVDGIKVHYLPVFYDNKLSKLSRIFSFIKFIWMAYQECKQVKDVTICYATSTPLTIGLLALVLKKIHKIPFIFEVRDLWPLAPIQLGFIKNVFLKRTLFYLEQKLYKEAQKVIVLSKGSFEYVEKIIPSLRIILAPNLSDCDFYQLQPKTDELKNKYTINNHFVISYLGAIGKANHLDYLIEIAEYCQQELPEILFLIIGEGSEKERLIELGKELKNIRFLPYGNKEYIKEILTISDATYTSFLKIPVLENNSPNKFFDSLAAGKLTIVNTKGWLQEIVENNECGLYINPSYPHLFVENMKLFVENNDKLVDYQENARKTALMYFDKKIILKRIVNSLNN